MYVYILPYIGGIYIVCWFIARCIVLRSGTIGVQVQVDRCVNKKCRLSDYLAGKSFCQRFDWIVGALRGGVFFL